MVILTVVLTGAMGWVAASATDQARQSTRQLLELADAAAVRGLLARGAARGVSDDPGAGVHPLDLPDRLPDRAVMAPHLRVAEPEKPGSRWRAARPGDEQPT